MKRRSVLVAGLLGLSLGANLNTVVAAPDTWPSRAIRIVVPTLPGSAPDVMARQIGELLNQKHDQPVIVENKAGASGLLASRDVIRAKPDGYTLLMTINSFITLTPHVMPMDIDPMNELTPILEVSRNNLVLTGFNEFPPNDIDELINYVKSKPGEIDYASYSTASVSHLAGLVFNELVGTDLNHIGYKSAAPAQLDVLSGRVPLMFDSFTSARSPLAEKRIKAFAVNSPQRLELAPDIPTFRELGYQDLEGLAAWVGLFGPADMPNDLAEKIFTEFSLALNDESITTRSSQLGFSKPQTTSFSDFKSYVKKENDELKALITRFDIQAQ